jgi:DNA-binding transcriptional regulator YbjK
MIGSTRRTEPGRRDRLIDVTLEVIADRGLAGATYRTVADLARVPLGSMTYHFPSRDDLVFAAFERFANDSFSSLDDAVADSAPDADVRERLVRMIVADTRGRQRDRVLLAELYVLAFRDERYAELMRRWMRRAKTAIERQVDGVSGHVIDAVQEGLTLQRYFLPEEFSEDIVRSALLALSFVPDDTTRRSQPR